MRAASGDLGTDIFEITPDSRKAKPGALFVAIPGTALDGHDFIGAAVAKGASAVAVSRPIDPALPVPQVQVDDPRRAMAVLAARLYGDPSSRLRVAGVTGTNGKTSVTYLLEAILRAAGRNPAVIGTVNYRYGGKAFEAPHTTPESVDLQRLLGEMLTAGVTDVVMEVSSHASAMERVRGIHFDAVGFTNLTQDHLDFHQDLDDYFAAKQKLFTDYLPESAKKDKAAVINDQDQDPRGEALFRETPGKKFRVGFKGRDEISCRRFGLSENGIRAEVSFPGLSRPLSIVSSLMGRHNLENILVAVGLAHALGVAPEAIVQGISDLRAVPGRLERIDNAKGVHAFVDYAHTPDALARVCEVLKGLAQKTGGRQKICGRKMRRESGFAGSRSGGSGGAGGPPAILITVFGCGGDRDKTKRPEMGREAGRRSDVVIVTSDNPRTEDPEAILDGILPGLRESGLPKDRLFRVPDRREALKKAVTMARSGDFLLVAGKGHEDYQIIGKTKVHFSDQEILRELLK